MEEQIPPLMADLRPGFRLLTDLSGLESMDLACVPYIQRMMDLCNKKGVEMVVRVIPDPHKDIGLNILSLFHYRRRVRIVTCATLEEAMKASWMSPESEQLRCAAGRRNCAPYFAASCLRELENPLAVEVDHHRRGHADGGEDIPRQADVVRLVEDLGEVLGAFAGDLRPAS